MIAARALTIAIAVGAAASLALACDGGAGANGSTDRGGNCATCHMPEYQAVTDPVHVDKKPTTCVVCHVQDGWRPSAVNHPFWALTGAHEGADCLYCHGHKGAPPTFKGTPKDCASCHGPEYNSSTFPGHATFPTKCADCHTTKAFKPATFTPPPVVVALVPGAPGGRPLPPLTKLAPGQKSAPGSRPGLAVPVPPPPPLPPPRAPSRPPDVISRPSPRR